MKLIGYRTYSEIKENIIPPLWMWVRLALYLSIAGLLFVFEQLDFAKIVFVLSLASFVGGIVAVVCKAFANGLKRLRDKAKK